MKNINYDLLKLLHSTLDNVWRLENYYIRDAKAAKCHSVKALEQMLKNERKHAETLKKEISMRMNARKFD